PLLRAARGRVVNIGSMAGFFSTAFQGPYCASKHAIEAFTDSMRRELEPFGMHVLLIQPGSIESRLIDKADDHARALLRTLTDQQRALYAEAAERSLYAAGVAREHAAKPHGIIRAVTHALESKRPRPRYVVGTDAHIGKLLTKALPDRAMDWLLRKLDQALKKKLSAEAANRPATQSAS
ncbi:MAG TPA: SDR family NAD(P)-dependent oxidoreductase, partial [Polyangiales bacterium]|nr:SDR family NAD(P)-dependent oxidoreductase [Polyangiales bacterium]